MATSPDTLRPPDETARKEPAPARATGLARTFQSLSNYALRHLWLSTLGSFGAYQMQMVAFGYLAYVLTGSALVLGLVSMASGAVQTVFAFFSGTAVDRLPKRRLLLTTQSTLGVIAAVAFVLVATGAIQVWQLAAIAMAQGVVFAFNMPARQALLAHLTRSPGELQNAIALSTAGQNVMRVLGPSLAGVILSLPLIGRPGVFFAMAACYGWAVFSITRIKNRGEVAGRRTSSVGADIKAGWAFIGRSPVLLSLLLLSFAASLLGVPYIILMPVFALSVFQVGSAGLGVLLAVDGVGSVLGALLTAYLSDSEHKGRIQFYSGLVLGLAIAAFALSPSIWTALPALLLTGICSSVVLSINNSLIMAHTPSAMYGRVMSAYMLSFALSPFGVTPMSALADAIGARPTVAGGGALLFFCVLAICLGSPALRRLRT